MAKYPAESAYMTMLKAFAMLNLPIEIQNDLKSKVEAAISEGIELRLMKGKPSVPAKKK